MRGIEEIKRMIEDVTGISFEKYSTIERSGVNSFPRILFAHECRRLFMTTVEIAKLLNRSHSVVVYYEKKYDELICFDQYFKSLVESIKMWKAKNEQMK